MRSYSIRTKVSVLFIVVFLLVCALFALSIILEMDIHHENQSLRQKNVIKSLTSNYNENSNIDLLNYLLSNSFSIVKGEKLSNKIKSKGNEIFKVATNFGVFTSISYNNQLFLQVQNQDHDLILESNKENTSFKFIFLGFLLSLALTTFLYISIINSLKPLTKLRLEVAQTASGKSFSPQGYQNNEIGKIATEFYNTMNKNHQLIESRQLFLRTIMHEIKTPIGKGRIIAEMIEENKQKGRLIAIFERLNSLINEFAKVESLLSKNYNLQFKNYHFSELLKEAKIFLMRDDFEQRVQVKLFEDAIFKADIEIFPLVIKNLIDNAMKHSDDESCIVECYKDHFVIKNKAAPLKQSIQEYFKAFTRDKDNKSEGMGLGLYIIERICMMHNFSLGYAYINGFHQFQINQEKNSATQQQ
ncbi:HAMP domain-containing histidine kinase [Campylobacter sp. MIT 19-121]|uniref:ArsS family sensor histidine kinase n=1 Tax=Campylobacter sp. MIT 19-121 TaxID=2703906 RepID=UPI00138A5CC5|nr:ArsS family sensor histidine kinase [Campylobacter sp. MIT 19-121]NDJ28008.1 HAMP domain-containing histidine kinase [Campylobacter sp. MIT 19-121]